MQEQPGDGAQGEVNWYGSPSLERIFRAQWAYPVTQVCHSVVLLHVFFGLTSVLDCRLYGRKTWREVPHGRLLNGVERVAESSACSVTV